MNDFLRQLLFLPRQGSTMAGKVDSLHYFVILMTMGGAALITLIGGYFLVRYRRRTKDVTAPHPGATAQPPLLLEVAALVALGVMFLGWWNIGTRQFVELRTPPLDALDIYVTGKQWMWKFAYPGGQSMISVLYVPVGKPIRLIVTSRDVIHSFYVPEFRIKQDAVPGRYTTAWFEVKEPGAYPILCTEYCGTSHSMMRGEVIALGAADFERWLAYGPGATPLAAREAASRAEGPQAGAPEVRLPSRLGGGLVSSVPELTVEPTLAERGRVAAAEYGCLRCHTLDGSAYIGPTWGGLYRSSVPLSTGGDVLSDEAYITESIMDPLAKVHRGFDPVMPPYVGRIPTPEVAAIVELIKSLRDVPRGPVEQVAPREVDAGVPEEELR